MVIAHAILDTSTYNATTLHVKLITSMLHMFGESCHPQAGMCAHYWQCKTLLMKQVFHVSPTGNNPVSLGMAILTQRHTTQCLYKGTQEQNNVTYLYSIIKEHVTIQYIMFYYIITEHVSTNAGHKVAMVSRIFIGCVVR